MKSLKLFLINALTLVIGLGLMSGSVSQSDAQAARFESVPSLSVTGLGNHRGQYLTVLYVIASRPLIGEDSDIEVLEVKESKAIRVTADRASFPAAKIAKSGFRPSYNMVLAVISAQPGFSWNKKHHRYLKLKVLSKSDIGERRNFDFNSLP
jgi:hypothetical protein